ncbi:MAG: ABC transporter ATP-binding protein [Halobacteriota archaeon]
MSGLIGPNGAGKTTTFNLLSGFYKPDAGEILFKGRPLHEYMYPDTGERRVWAVASGGVLGLASGWVAGSVEPTTLVTTAGLVGGFVVGTGIYYGQQALRERYLEERPSRPFLLTQAGMSRTFQITRELGDMTVLENLMLGPPDQAGERLSNIWLAPGDVRRQETEIRDRAVEVLELLDLEHLANDYAGNLSGGQRKLLELGRVLMTDPEVILLDEPVAGVNPSLQNILIDRILELRDEGYSFCVVEHDMDVIMSISDTVIVMDQGQVLVEGPPEIIREDERVIDAYLGDGS